MKHLGPLLTFIIVPIVVPIVMRALSRSAVSEHVAGKTSAEVRYGVPMKLLGVLGLVMGAFMLIAPVVLRARAFQHFDPRSVAILLITGPMGCSIIFLFLEVFLVHHTVDTHGITCRSVFHRPFRFLWGEIKTVEYNAVMSWFVFQSTDGRVGRVAPYMAGIRTLAELTLAHLDRSVLTDLAWKGMSGLSTGKPVVPGVRPD